MVLLKHGLYMSSIGGSLPQAIFDSYRGIFGAAYIYIFCTQG